ncbi:MAG: ROK family protein [Acidimicrobiia bacterium]|nr:ROK family protein [Acidimicrobiia bacterium]MYC57070.1 ROK family protein [Acidimicrobiia bacterium]MYG93677.1 ROK family protein [Acidimicrobiia bacterium]MYI30147.1 ROK family protein [Acidimicrobiia bacterium]
MASSQPCEAFGIDIGGSGIKAAPVNTLTGELLEKRHRIPTPKPGTPDAITEVIYQLVRSFGWNGPVGCTFPGPIVEGMVKWITHLDDSWAGMDFVQEMSNRIGAPVTVINDADAAGIAEIIHGAGVGRSGTVCFNAFGTGIGSAVFVNGSLVPNTEFGHLYLAGHHSDVETYAAARILDLEDLQWSTWVERVRQYLEHLETLISPSLFILGGGISKDFDIWGPLLEIETEVAVAEMRNNAGIVGAAMVSCTTMNPL